MLSGDTTLDEITITDALNTRPPGVRDLAAENDAFLAIARHLGAAAPTLRALTEAGVRLCGAGSCGVSLLETHGEGGDEFRWVSLSGALAGYEGHSTPAAFSPCGVCLEYGVPQLFAYPGRYFAYFDETSPRITEGLVIPFRGRGHVMGTIWIVAHDDTTHFSASDVAVMTGLADFTAAAIVLMHEEQLVRSLLERERLAREEAQAANRAKDVFLATVSHELRTPLNAVLGWADVLANAPAAAESLPAVLGIQNNSSRLVRLVDDLLDASHASKGQLPLALAHVDLEETVRRLLQDVRPRASDRGLTLDAKIAPGDFHVIADEERIRQVFSNLLDNALKFTSSGSIRVELDGTETDVTVRIVDTGIGIDPGFLPHVFEPFAQAEHGEARRYRGLGLGLSIARDIVVQHGGRLACSSGGPQLGSEFIVSFPREAAMSTVFADGVAPAAHVSAERAVPQIAGIRVLLVDDDPDARQVLSAMLLQHGANVCTAESAAEALNVLRTRELDVLLADIAMPDDDGLALIAQARALEHAGRTRVPAVAVTALATPADRSRVLAAGFDVHLPKPVRMAALVSSLASLVGRESPESGSGGRA